MPVNTNYVNLDKNHGRSGYNKQQEKLEPKVMMESEPSTPVASETMLQNDSQ